MLRLSSSSSSSSLSLSSSIIITAGRRTSLLAMNNSRINNNTFHLLSQSKSLSVTNKRRRSSISSFHTASSSTTTTRHYRYHNHYQQYRHRDDNIIHSLKKNRHSIIGSPPPSTTTFFSSQLQNNRVFSSSPHRSSSPFSVAIVGAGPSGFYTAKYLRSTFRRRRRRESEKVGNDDNNNDDDDDDDDNFLSIDLIDRLPTPYGLVRSGVAPDHPEVKNVEHDFTSLFSSSSSSSMSYWGNVTVGKDITIEELSKTCGYDAIVLAYGCDGDRLLTTATTVEGSNKSGGYGLEGIFSAREFVAWYNGHPDYVSLSTRLSPLLSQQQPLNVVIIGQGNVALDCARVLTKATKKGLDDTDIASHALEMLKRCTFECVTVAGRRGHVQAAFTIKELRELIKLQKDGYDTSFTVHQSELNRSMTPTTQRELTKSRPRIRMDKLLQSVAVTDDDDDDDSKTSQNVRLRFLLNPVRFVPREDDAGRVGGVVFEGTELVGEEQGRQRARGLGWFETIKAELVLISIGYKGQPLPGLEHHFDTTKNTITNHHGRIVAPTDNTSGLYVTGWLKRGPTGIIGSNIPDARETVESIVKDYDETIKNRQPQRQRKRDDGVVTARGRLDQILKERGVKVVDWEGWKKIDEKETSKEGLRCEGQPREKIVSVDEMLKVLDE